MQEKARLKVLKRRRSARMLLLLLPPERERRFARSAKYRRICAEFSAALRQEAKLAQGRKR